MKAKDLKNMQIVGIFMLVMMGIFMFFVATLSQENAWFDTKMTVSSKLKDAQGLKQGGIVRLKGIKIGYISKIEIQNELSVIIQAVVSQKYNHLIKSDSSVEVSSKGLVGDKLLQINPGNPAASAYQEGVFLPERPTVGTTEILNQGKDMAEKAEQVMDQINLLLAKFNHKNHLETTLANIADASKNMEKLSAQMSHQNLPFQLKKTLLELESMMKRINQGPGTLHSLIYDDQVYDQAEDVLGGAKRNRILKYFIRQSLRDKKVEDKKLMKINQAP